MHLNLDYSSMAVPDISQLGRYSRAVIKDVVCFSRARTPKLDVPLSSIPPVKTNISAYRNDAAQAKRSVLYCP